MSRSSWIIIIIVLVLAVGGFYFYQNSTKTSSSNQPSANSNPSVQPSTSSQTSLANPASVNCSEKGGKLEIKKRGDGGEYGICSFEGGGECEEWALMRGQCPIGGVKVIGFDNPEQIYCAILGGKTEAVKNASCTLPNGVVCSVVDLYNGKCSTT